MSKKLPVAEFEWVCDLSMFTEDFIKNYDKESDVGYLKKYILLLVLDKRHG